MRILRQLLYVAASGAVLLPCAPGVATTITDAQGDFLSTYIGTVAPDLDILQFTVSRNETSFVFDVLVNGTIGTTPTIRYNIGVNRGSGTNRFGEDFRPGTSFDTTINLIPFGPGEVRNFGPTTEVTPLSSSTIMVSGSSLSAAVPISLLPSTGFVVDDYTFLLWSRTPQGTPPQLGIADFAPDAGAIRAVPEPATWLMMLIGFGAAGLAFRGAAGKRPTVHGATVRS